MIEDSYGRCAACGCVGPNPGYSALSREELAMEMENLSLLNWQVENDGKSIYRKFTCKNWQAAMDCINAISAVAESKDIQHHPDIHLTKYRDVEIRLWTHAVGGLTMYDLKLAQAINSTVVVDYSKKWLLAQQQEEKNT